MRPAAAVVATFRTPERRAVVSNRIKDGDFLLGEAEEDVVAIAEAVIDSKLKTVRIVDRRPDLREIVCRIARKVRPWRIRSGKTAASAQRSAPAESCGKQLRWSGPAASAHHRQRIAGGIAAKWIPGKGACPPPCRVRIIDVATEGRVGEIASDFGGRGHISQA